MDAKPTKNPTVAGILSGLMPGLGQFYCRQWKKGAGFLLGAIMVDVSLGVSAGFIKLLQAGGIGLAVDDVTSILLRSLPFLAIALWSVFDAVRTAKRSR